MFKRHLLNLVFSVLLTGIIMPLPASALSAEENRPGFLVVAMDRGALGNKEVEKVFEKFGQEYPAVLTFIGWEEDKYKPYFIASLKELKAKRVKRLVIIPMIVSRHDPYFEKMEKTVNAAIDEVFGPDSGRLLADPIGESYLFDQILYDRIAAVSKEPEQERLVVVGLGAVINRLIIVWTYGMCLWYIYMHENERCTEVGS